MVNSLSASEVTSEFHIEETEPLSQISIPRAIIGGNLRRQEPWEGSPFILYHLYIAPRIRSSTSWIPRLLSSLPAAFTPIPRCVSCHPANSVSGSPCGYVIIS